MDAKPISKARTMQRGGALPLERDRLTERTRAEDRAAELGRLAEALWLPDPARCETLFALGITAETASAFEALPLVEVAWADGGVDEEERWPLLEAAMRLGVELGGLAHAVLESWLVRRPPPELFAAWHDLAGRTPRLRRRRGRGVKRKTNGGRDP